ncbi:MAG: dipeptidase PepE [Chitinophagaceae bacterium]|nr:dipeptidase PepE [Chitinophagaceae bacterium]
MKVLALSSSRAGNSAFLEPAIPHIKSFLGEGAKKLAFIPFASAGSYEDYLHRVQQALGDFPFTIELVKGADSDTLIESCDAIVTGGGNTFKLLHHLYQFNLIGAIRKRIKEQGIPYIGWSAGANILGATICTTNDMPIIYPPSFEALKIFPFQINPHYQLIYTPGFNGETRDDRLAEFLTLNPQSVVIALPEGTALLANDEEIIFKGGECGYRFSYEAGGVEKRQIVDGQQVER